MKTFAMGAVALLTVAVVIVFSTHEPRYQGRPLTRWLEQCFDRPLMETQRLAQAQDAVRAIGAKKALPKLLKLVETKDDPVSLWIIATGDRFRISDEYGDRFIRWHSALDFQWLGERGFEALGTNAEPAAGALGKLLDGKFPNELDERLHTLVVERCLESIGKPAEPVICRLLTHQDAAIRQWAIDQLASVTDDVDVYITHIKPCLQDSSGAVRAATVDAIGIQTGAPELAVPLLLKALQDSAVSANAAHALANFGTNAVVAFSQLTNLVESGNENVAGAALRTLIVIAPDASFPIFTNHLAQGKPDIEAALKALTEAAPDRALPIILNYLQSPDVKMRRRAFGLLRSFPATSQIESAMQAVAADTDSDLALAAKGFLTGQYVANHPDEFLFPDEPSYGGKQLGKWLETRVQGSGEFTPEAKAAIRHLGTNAIPALLKRLTYVRPTYCFSSIQINLNASGGFIALGEQTKSALPELQTLMDSTNMEIDLAAMIATCGTGSNAIPFLIKGLTNQFGNVRNAAANALASDDLGGLFPKKRKEAIPFLVKLLNDPDDDVRMSATNQLKQIDPAAAAKAGIK